jgi:uncharacterized protein
MLEKGDLMSAEESHESVGSVLSVWRYPVKSMLGEEVRSSFVTERGLLGDRAYALMDRATGKVVSAKNPRKWPTLFKFKAALMERIDMRERIPPVMITLPNGTRVNSEQRDVDRVLSNALDSDVLLKSQVPERPQLEEYWPDVENLPHRDAVTEEEMPPDGFFDGEVIHLLTTATLDKLNSIYPEGRFDPLRFRPNLVVVPAPTQSGFVENSWIGRTIAIGEQVRLNIIRPTSRCVMTTLAQSDLPKDLGILRTAVQANNASVGVYATIAHGGFIRRDDPVTIE